MHNGYVQRLLSLCEHGFYLRGVVLDGHSGMAGEMHFFDEMRRLRPMFVDLVLSREDGMCRLVRGRFSVMGHEMPNANVPPVLYVSFNGSCVCFVVLDRHSGMDQREMQFFSGMRRLRSVFLGLVPAWEALQF
jgi:hypothetical protein